MWINDTTYAVKKIDAEITASTNINYVKSYHIHQVFKNVDGKYWMLKKDQLFVDFGLTKKLLGLFGRKTTIYDSIRVNEPQPSDVYDPSKNVIVTENADTRTDDFWEEARLDSISKRESKIYQMVDSLKKVPLIKGTIDVVAMLLSGYLDWGNFQVGPYFTFYSYNPIEGSRFRFGGRTSSQFSRKVEFGAYLAYGLKDEAFKYGGSYRQILQRKNHQMIGLNYKHDVEQLGKSNNAFQESNFLNSILRRGPNTKLTMVDDYTMTYTRDFLSNYITKLIVNHRFMEPLGALFYQKEVNNELINISSITTTDASIYLKFAYKEKFLTGDLDRVSLGSNYPIVEAQYTQGLKGVFESEYEYQKLEISISDNLKLGIFGYTDYKLVGNKIWGTLPIHS